MSKKFLSVFKKSGTFKVLAFLTLILLSIAILYYLKDGNQILKTGVLGIYRCTYSFFMGCLISEIFLNRRIQEYAICLDRNSNNIFSMLEILLISVSLLSVMYLDKIDFIVPVLFSLTIFVFSFERGMLSRVLDKPFFKKIGLLSYSIYMNNVLIKTIFDIVILRFWKVDTLWYDLALIPYIVILYFTSKITYELFEVRGKIIFERVINLIVKSEISPSEIHVKPAKK